MAQLITGLLIFLGVHCVSIVNEGWRDKMAERLGVWTWKGIYSMISLVGLIMIIRGYGNARVEVIELYITPAWLQHIALVLMIPVFPLLLSAYLPGRIKAAVGHPMLLAAKIWAAAHLLANGDSRSIALFGGLGTWAIAEVVLCNRRDGAWEKPEPAPVKKDFIAVAAGLVVYLVFANLHAWLFGFSPFIQA